ncbi:MAG: right-handed parallel beta-helix repeat-containing protein [Cyanobacteria bacterium P01_G01_bin.54]
MQTEATGWAILPLLMLTVSWGTGTLLPSRAIAQSLHKGKKIAEPSAQPVQHQVVQQQAQVIENINPGLWLDPRWGVQFTTGPGAGYESSFGSFYGWIPVAQDGFETLFYTEAQTRIDTHSGRWGGNLAVGYRNFGQAAFIFGGYASYDVQDVGSFTAHQLGLGVEALHPRWQARLNGYLPIGDRSTTVGESSTTVSQTFTNARFTGDQLFVTPQSTVRNDVTSDSSLAGFDLEGGLTLTTWPGGQLQGFFGSYLYGGPGTNSFVGVRSRLQAELEHFNAGLALQSDRIFGTNVTFTIGASLGGRARSASEAATEAAIVALLSKPTQRQKNVTIRRHTESTFSTTTEAEGIALNPDTGDPWQFIHVDLNTGSAVGSGAEGDPFDTIAGGIAQATSASGNEVVYVEGTGTEAGFTIPAKVKVLSSGPEQLLNVTTASSTLSGTTTLPRSGTGNTPQLTSTVSFSDGGGELDGFAITTSSGNGVDLANITGTVAIENNQISNPYAQGVSVTNTAGTLDLTISSNTITNAGDDAIRGDISSSAVLNVTISNNQINTVSSPASATFPIAEGIDLEARGNAQITASINGNTITNADNSGIELEAYDSTIINSTITSNTIDSTGGDGILLLHESDQALTMTVSKNKIENSGATILSASNPSGLTRTEVAGNASINIGSGGFGIAIVTLGNGSLNLMAESNTISNSQDAKFGIAVNPSFLFNANTVTSLSALPDAVAAAIVSARFAGSSQVNATLRLNTFSGTGIGLKDLSGPPPLGLSDYNTGSFGALVGDGGTLCLNLENNTAAEVGSSTISGYQFVQNGSSSTLTLGTNSGNNGSFVTTEGTVGSGSC